MAKIELDKYYTPQDLVELVINRTKEVIGLDNITEFIEPSAGNGAFLDSLYSLGKPVIAYDIAPERDDIIKRDYLELELDYQEGRCVIGNPPFGSRGNLFKQFYNKSIQISDYIVFICSIKLLNNINSIYKFDLIHSEDLGFYEYSGVNIHCCLNIYKRPKNGIFNKKPNYKLNSILVYREDDKKYKYIKEDLKICRMGDVWKILDSNDNLRNFKIVLNDKSHLNNIVNAIHKKYKSKNIGNNISTPYIAKTDIYKYLKEEIPELE